MGKRVLAAMFAVAAGSCGSPSGTGACGGATCDPNASCITSGAASSCECNPGYLGDGLTCTASLLPDAGEPDAGEGGPRDAGPGGQLDAGATGAGSRDANEVDAGPADSGENDAGEFDGGIVDGGPGDGGMTDGGRDAGSPDAGIADGGHYDAGPPFPPYDAGPGTSCPVNFCGDGTCTSFGPQYTCDCPQGEGIVDGTCRPVATGFESISAQTGDRFCAIGRDGTLWCWGLDESVPETSNWIAIPWQVGADTDWMASAPGGLFLCAQKQDGTVWCRGDGLNEPFAMQEVGSAAWSSVSSSTQSTCAVKADHTLWCWPPSMVVSPVQFGTESDWESWTATNLDMCALKTDGSLWCWGDNITGVDGNGTTTSVATPTQVAGTWESVSLSNDHACGIKTDGSLSCWGNDSDGQLGNASGLTPRVAAAGTDWKKVGAGSDFTCALKTGGAIWCWGTDTEGQLGDDFARVRPSLRPAGDPVPRPMGTETDWVDLAVAGSAACGLKSDGTIWCWGSNTYGALGTGVDEAVLNASATVPARLYGLQAPGQLVIDGGTVCLLDAVGQLWCSGSNSSGQFGVAGDKTSLDSYALASPGFRWQAITSDSYSDLCGISVDGSLWCWGPLQMQVSGPQLISPMVWTALSQGCAIDALGQLSCVSGGLFLNSNGAGNLINSDTDWAALSTTSDFGCALKRSGALWCWGTGLSGQLGIGLSGANAENQPPQQVGTATWLSVSAAAPVCGIQSDHSLWCWGDLSHVFGMPNAQTTPLKIGSDLWSMINCGQYSCAGVRADGTLVSGFSGSSAIQVGSATDWAMAVTNGYNGYLCASKLDGSVWCAGVDATPVGLRDAFGSLPQPVRATTAGTEPCIAAATGTTPNTLFLGGPTYLPSIVEASASVTAPTAETFALTIGDVSMSFDVGPGNTFAAGTTYAFDDTVSGGASFRVIDSQQVPPHCGGTGPQTWTGTFRVTEATLSAGAPSNLTIQFTAACNGSAAAGCVRYQAP